MSNEAVIKCKIFTGTKFEDGGNVRFMTEGVNNVNTIDKGYFDFFDLKEFKLHIQVFALAMGMYIDAYDKNDNIFWSNYQEVDEAPDVDALRKEYKELSGEDSKGNWGVKKLVSEIKILKEK